MKRFLIAILAAVMLTACQKTPENVKEKYSSDQSDTISVAELDLTAQKVDVSQLDTYSEKLPDYIEQKGWGTKFNLKKGTKVNSVSELYAFKLKQSDKVHERFPEIYGYIYGSDFAEQSGKSDVHELAKVDTDHMIPGFKYVTSLIDYVMYDDPNTYSEEHRQSDNHLTVGQTGFIYYCLDTQEQALKTAERINYDRSENSAKMYTMCDGSQCSPDEAKAYAEEYINDLFGYISNDFCYSVSNISVKLMQNGKHSFDIVFRKTFNSVQMTDLFVGEYPGTQHTKPMYYECSMSGKAKINMVRAPYAFENVEKCERITDKVIPVTEAVSILDKKLAKNIKLDISEVKLMYYNEYDASENEKSKRKKDEGEELTKAEQLELIYPYWANYREYDCYPVWAFYMPRNTASDSGDLYDYILVNALTGEVINNIDRGSSY